MGACTWSEIFEEDRKKREAEEGRQKREAARKPTDTELLTYGGGREKPGEKPAEAERSTIWDRLIEDD